MNTSKTGAVHELPDEMKAVFAANTVLRSHWDSLTELTQNEWICWVITCKQQATRDKHLVRMKEDMLKGKRRPCCWPGCPHRRENAEKWFSKGALEAAKSQLHT